MTTFRFDPSTRELHGQVGRVQVEPQVGRLLAALLRTPGEVVPYVSVAAAIWPAPAARPGQPGPGVRVVIGRLRAALRRVGAKEVVQTLASIGLRLLSPASVHDGEEPPPASPEPGLILDPTTRMLLRGRQEVALSRREAALIRALLSAAGPVPRAELLAAVWEGHDAPAASNVALRVKLSQLRRKLRVAGVPVRITHVHGVGYQVQAGEPLAAVSEQRLGKSGPRRQSKRPARRKLPT